MARYGETMIESAVQPDLQDSVEALLREELAQGDQAAASIVPVLQNVLDTGSNALFGEQIVAGVRGMMADIAGQMLDAQLQAAGEADWRSHDPAAGDGLTAALAEHSALLLHVHALAIEWRLTGLLQARQALDPVLPPLLQSLIASQDPAMAAPAMNLLAAQARFCQAQRRFSLPLSELPGDLLQAALQTMRTLAGSGAHAEMAEVAIRAKRNGVASRLDLLASITMNLGGERHLALSLGNAGTAIFLTALGLASRHDRDQATLMTSESQFGRLALALRSSGLRPEVVAGQFALIHPDTTLPDGFDRLTPDRAAAMLAGGG